jgi:hypothetical protein
LHLSGSSADLPQSPVELKPQGSSVAPPGLKTCKRSALQSLKIFSAWTCTVMQPVVQISKTLVDDEQASTVLRTTWDVLSLRHTMVCEMEERNTARGVEDPSGEQASACQVAARAEGRTVVMCLYSHSPSAPSAVLRLWSVFVVVNISFSSKRTRCREY